MRIVALVQKHKCNEVIITCSGTLHGVLRGKFSGSDERLKDGLEYGVSSLQALVPSFLLPAIRDYSSIRSSLLKCHAI